MDPVKLEAQLKELCFAPPAATATVAMDPVKLEAPLKGLRFALPAATATVAINRVKLAAQLKELKAELKKLNEEGSLPGANKLSLSEMEKMGPYLEEVSKKQKAALHEAYSNRELPILRLNSQEYPCCTVASPPVEEDCEGEAGAGPGGRNQKVAGRPQSMVK